MAARQPRVGQRGEYLKAWYLANRDKELARAKNTRQERKAQTDAIKLESGCVDCGYNEHAIALDFDHVRGKKVAHVGTLLARGASMSTVLAEIAKCEVVCANCHRVRTALRREQSSIPTAV